MGEPMKFGSHHLIFLVVWILPIVMCLACFGVDPAFGQNFKGHGKQKNLIKETAMADTDKLTEAEGRQLLSVARDTIEQRIFDRKKQHR